MNKTVGLSIAGVFVVAGCASTPAPPPETVTVTTTMPASEVEQQRIDRQQQDMDRRAAELDEREAAIQTSEAIAAESTFSGDGTFLVGQEIMPGTWRSQGSQDPPKSCYWARLASFTGEAGSIIANENSKGPTVVTIEPSDVAFETNRCGTWTRIG